MLKQKSKIPHRHGCVKMGLQCAPFCEIKPLCRQEAQATGIHGLPTPLSSQFPAPRKLTRRLTTSCPGGPPRFCLTSCRMHLCQGVWFWTCYANLALLGTQHSPEAEELAFSSKIMLLGLGFRVLLAEFLNFQVPLHLPPCYGSFMDARDLLFKMIVYQPLNISRPYNPI